VLELVALGLPNKAVAQRLSISEHTVKFHASGRFVDRRLHPRLPVARADP
jgi:DNA-binding NarL/FixJ family response regulator